MNANITNNDGHYDANFRKLVNRSLLTLPPTGKGAQCHLRVTHPLRPVKFLTQQTLACLTDSIVPRRTIAEEKMYRIVERLRNNLAPDTTTQTVIEVIHTVQEIHELTIRLALHLTLAVTHMEVHRELEWLQRKRRAPTHTREWETGREGHRKKGRITWEAIPRGYRRRRTLERTNRTNSKNKKYPHYSATKKTRVTRNELKRWAALLRETHTQQRRESWRQRTPWTTKQILTGLKTALMQTVKSTNYGIRKTLTNTLKDCTNIWKRILTGLITVGATAGNFNRGEVKWQYENGYQTRNDGTNISTRDDRKAGEQWETDLEKRGPRLTKALEEIGESWGPHKPITKKRATRKKWNNHSATKGTITTIGNTNHQI
eukprot:4225654-Pyramimonas_sp.AAC.1